MKPLLAVLTAASLPLVACGDPSRAAETTDYPTRLVLADADTNVTFHPATGYGQAGVSPIYDGLLRPVPSTEGALPTFQPALAATMPARDGARWTVHLKPDVTFSDGSTVDSRDVKASYELAKDTARGSEVASSYDIIEGIETPDDHTVVFQLSAPIADLSARLTYPISPSEKLENTTVSESELNAHPVGTGPYRFVEKRGNDTVFTANEQYWGGAPEVKELVITTMADDGARGQRVLAGDIDGAVIPQVQAKNYQNSTRVTLDVAKSADWRGISLPAGLPVEVRRAMNLAVDRQALIDGPLAGFGSPAHTPVTALYGAAHDAEAAYPFDVAAAERLLDESGWRRGAQGIREKDGQRLELTLFYVGTDSSRRDVAIEFASHMKRIGIAVDPRAGTWDDITPQMSTAAVVLAGGEMPYDISMSTYDYLHTRTSATGAYHNAGNYGSAQLDAVLEDAVREPDKGKQDELWRSAQRLYLDNPSLVMIGTVDHVYVSKPNEWTKPQLQLEPHVHGATWGPWWRLAEWTR